MEALGVSIYQLVKSVHAAVHHEDADSWATRFNVATYIGVTALLLVRFMAISCAVGDAVVALVLVGAMNTDSFYYSMLRTVSLFVLTVTDSASGDMTPALAIYYSAVAFMSCLHTDRKSVV